MLALPGLHRQQIVVPSSSMTETQSPGWLESVIVIPFTHHTKLNLAEDALLELRGGVAARAGGRRGSSASWGSALPPLLLPLSSWLRRRSDPLLRNVYPCRSCIS
ncbi:Hypothetical predicted protein [Podarcis lilfordi]|uniref:Uncharacterized protein n=1 Tax=Podarcis lilfordi TaxID=74358 RepID=A0AA35KFU3_9SAUR|nr:Hypothetical predicted protein [Podarcis lilfordi]